MIKNLAMFDIDGTLTDTTGVDSKCYMQAAVELLGTDDFDTDLNNYTHITRAGITLELIERTLGRPARPEEVSSIKNNFSGLLTEAALSDPTAFKQVQGAGLMLEALASRDDMTMSLATGGWREEAELKLEMARIDFKKIPMASSSDAVSRVDILKIAEQRTLGAVNLAAFNSVIYIGDGAWDVHTSKAVGYEFIGVGSGEKAEILKQAGAMHIIPDFSDIDGFFGLLNELFENGANKAP